MDLVSSGEGGGGVLPPPLTNLPTHSLLPRPSAQIAVVCHPLLALALTAQVVGFLLTLHCRLDSHDAPLCDRRPGRRRRPDKTFSQAPIRFVIPSNKTRHPRLCTHTHTHRRMKTHTHTYAYIHTRTCTHTHTEVNSLFPNTLCVSAATGVSAVDPRRSGCHSITSRERGEARCCRRCRNSSVHLVDALLPGCLSVRPLVQAVTRFHRLGGH